MGYKHKQKNTILRSKKLIWEACQACPLARGKVHSEFVGRALQYAVKLLQWILGGTFWPGRTPCSHGWPSGPEGGEGKGVGWMGTVPVACWVLKGVYR